MNRRLRHRASQSPRKHASGFTLIEIILATVLLALGLGIAFASLHSANGSVQRAESAAARNEHLRAVQGFLYRTLQSAQPLVLERESGTGQVDFFEGAHDKMQFVAPMPGYLSRGGPHVMTLKLAPSNKGDGTQNLQFAYTMLVNEKPLDDDKKLPSEDLLDGIAEAHFDYRGLGQDAKIGDWQSEWKRPSGLPIEVRLVLRFADPKRPWPAFATALPLGFASAHAENATPGIQPPLLRQQTPPSLPTAGGGK